jgi:hypothetical protein
MQVKIHKRGSGKMMLVDETGAVIYCPVFWIEHRGRDALAFLAKLINLKQRVDIIDIIAYESSQPKRRGFTANEKVPT